MLPHYAGLAPLASITREYRARLCGTVTAAPSAAGDIAPANSIVTQLAAMAAQIQSLVANEERLLDRAETLTARTAPRPHLLNLDSGMWHEDRLIESIDYPALWMSTCGWRFANANFRRSAAIPLGTGAKLICGKCLPLLKAEARLRDSPPVRAARSSSSSSSSG